MNIIFLDKHELLDILLSDKDRYYKTFYPLDFKVRNVDSIKQYKENIKKSVCSFSNTKQQEIIKMTIKIDHFLSTLYSDFFDGYKASLIPWKIGCIKSDLYEDGLPHTRLDTIIINKNTDLLTLLHEKIHIYQKKYKKDTKKYLSFFTKLKKREESDRIRANPDIDQWIYKDHKRIYQTIYVKNPKNIEDVRKYKYEHPLEKMAEDIENLFN
jgi:hypothetical protein